jgi:hypothetical protein
MLHRTNAQKVVRTCGDCLSTQIEATDAFTLKRIQRRAMPMVRANSASPACWLGGLAERAGLDLPSSTATRLMTTISRGTTHQNHYKRHAELCADVRLPH